MANEFSMTVRVMSRPVEQQLAEINRRQRRAIMYGLRESGRRLEREARARAPVYHGRPRMVSVYGKEQPLVPGELRKSIKSSRRLKNRGTDGFALLVGPRGVHVHLYAPKQEQRTRFMRAAYEATSGEARAIFERAVDRSIRSVTRGR